MSYSAHVVIYYTVFDELLWCSAQVRWWWKQTVDGEGEDGIFLGQMMERRLEGLTLITNMHAKHYPWFSTLSLENYCYCTSTNPNLSTYTFPPQIWSLTPNWEILFQLSLTAINSKGIHLPQISSRWWESFSPERSRGPVSQTSSS